MATKKNVKVQEAKTIKDFHVEIVKEARTALKEGADLTQRLYRSAHGMTDGILARNGTRMDDTCPGVAISFAKSHKLLDPKQLKQLSKLNEKDSIELFKQNGIGCAIIANAFQRSVVSIQSVRRQAPMNKRVRPNPFNTATHELVNQAALKITTTLAHDKDVPKKK